ncbi:hypothetical protein V7075_16220 [Neobacillus drentensis]|uniref:hypothetical protein n=1 Tax=Neobacillus drentensis TaxID=220684 RepID=UPI00300049BF
MVKITDVIDEEYYEQFNNHIFNAFLKMNDVLSTVLRGHLYIESELEKQLNEYLAHPEVLEMDRLKFSDKLTWLVALGLLSKENRMPYKRLNELRNKFAHNIEYQLQESDLEKIVNTFNKSQRKRYIKMVNDQTKNESRLRFCLFILWIDITLETEIIKMKKKRELLAKELNKELQKEVEIHNQNADINRKQFEQWLKIKTVEKSND